MYKLLQFHFQNDATETDYVTIPKWSGGSPILYTDWLNPRYNGILLEVGTNVFSYSRYWALSRIMYQGVVGNGNNVYINQSRSFWHSLKHHQPMYNVSQKCTGMFLSSRMHSPWIKFPCEEYVENTLLICENFTHSTTRTTFTSNSLYLVCSQSWILSNGNCFGLVQFSIQVAISAVDARLQDRQSISKLATLDQALDIAPYFKMFSRAPFSSIGVLVHSTATTCLSISSEISTDVSLAMSKTPKSITPTSCFNFSIVPDIILLQQSALMIHRKASCLRGQFTCLDRTCILASYICDGVSQCPDYSDEISCNDVCFHEGLQLHASYVTFCYQKCMAPACKCSDFYFQCNSGGCISWRSVCDCVQDCPDNSDELSCHNSICNADSQVKNLNTNHELFHCGDGNSIPVEMVNDILPDCPNQADEEIYISGNATLSGSHCQPPETMPCAYNHSTCFTMADLCVARFRDAGMLSGCRNGAHLENCDQFQCPMHFKCPSAYCIPTHYVCNGVFDCPNGEDEMSCVNLTCPGLLKCYKDDVCVHSQNINDGEIDCIQSADDEEYAQAEPCEWNLCQCRSDILICSNVSIPSIPMVKYPLRVLVVSGTLVSLEPLSFKGMHELLMLDLSCNQLKDLPKAVFRQLSVLIILHLHQNNITRLLPNTFTGLTNLRRLTLFGNPLFIISTSSFFYLQRLGQINLISMGINIINECAFADMSSCISLNLSGNALPSVSKGTFCGLLNLNVLDLRGNPLLQMEFDTFVAQQYLHMVFFPCSSFCCVVKNIEDCSPTLKGATTSCKGFIPGMGLRWAFRALAGTILFSNSASLGWWLFSNPRKMSILMVLISIADLIMGISAGILIGLDLQIQHVFVSLSSQVWRGSFLCVTVSIMTIFSFGASQYFLACLSLYRLVIVIYPFKEKEITAHALAGVSLCGSLAITGVAFLIVTDGGSQKINAASEICSIASFVIADDGISSSLYFFFTVNGLLVFALVAPNCWAIHALKGTLSTDIAETNNRNTHRKQAMLRLAISSFTGLITWLSIIVVILIQLGSGENAVTCNAVASFMLVPLNAAINPVIYSFTSPQFMSAMKEYFLI